MERIEFLNTLESIIEDRLRNPTEGSYTARLAAEGELKVAQKLGEEGVEVALSAVAESPARLTEEAADLLYHLLVLLKMRGLSLSAVTEELERRHKN